MSDVHQHYCRACRAPWEHDGDQIDKRTHKSSHQCPSCGTPGWVKFYGNETHDEMCEMEALLELTEDDRVPEPLRSQAECDFRRMARRLHRPGEPERAAAPGVWRPYYVDGSLEDLLDALEGLER